MIELKRKYIIMRYNIFHLELKEKNRKYISLVKVENF